MHRHLLAASVAVLLTAAGCGSSQTAEGHTPGCDSCHAFPAATASHASPPGGSWEATDCNACHPTSVSIAGTVVPTAAGGTHVNGVVDAAGHAASFPEAVHGPAANANLASCKACHGPNLDGGSAGVSCDDCHTGGAAWRTDCTFCHGDPARVAATLIKAAPPADVAGSLDPIDIGVGAHETHVVDRAYACTTCHVVPTGILDATHLNGFPATLTFGGLSVTRGAAPVWDHASATCASTWCHGQGGADAAPTWTSAVPRTCASCHPAVPTTNAHTEHLSGGTLSNGFPCASCHVVPASNAHLDGIVGVAFTNAVVAGGTFASGTCNNTYCHGTFTGGTGADPIWSGAGMACNSCHSSPPNTGDHGPHLSRTSCNTCHTGYTASTVNLTNHVNGIKNVAAGWNGSSCNNGCHGTSEGTWY